MNHSYAYTVMQLCISKKEPELMARLFTDYERTMELFGRINPDDYELADFGMVDAPSPRDACEKLFSLYNADERPHNYRGRSMSVSDLVILTDESTGEKSTWFCDSVGFKPLRPRKIVIVVDGGLVQTVYSDSQEFVVEVCDLDSDDEEEYESAANAIDAAVEAVERGEMFQIW